MNAQTQNMPTQSPAKAFQVYMQKYKSQLEMALPKHLTVDRMMRLSLTAFSQNPKLQQCTSNSIFSSIIIASQLGLEPGVNGQGYLVPYKETCTFIPGWKGLVDLAQRGGRSSVWTGAVYEGDEFDYMLGDAPYCRHKPCGEFDNDKLTHVYAIGRVKDSEMPIIEVWPVKKVRAHFVKTVVKGLQPNHYSHKHFEAYARKVALLQVLKYMPQSIELSNAMDVSNAQESGKGVTIDGDFVTVDNNNQEQQQDPNVQNSTQNEAISHQDLVGEELKNFDNKVPVDEDYAPTFAQIKRGILTAKSPAHLDVIEDQAMDHADKDERKQLMNLIKAQSQKFQPAEVVEEKKPEPQKEEAPKKATRSQPKVVEETAVKVDVQPEQTTNNTSTDLLYNKKKEGLIKRINEIDSVESLERFAPAITAAKLKPQDQQELMSIYAGRKEILSQQDIFDEEPQMSFVDSSIARIRNARSQDDINEVYADPFFEELSGADRERIDLEAQQREAELQD